MKIFLFSTFLFFFRKYLKKLQFYILAVDFPKEKVLCNI